MKIIGITGGIGSGKSYVLNIIKDTEGAYVIEADKLAHELMLPGNDAYDKIVEAFGKGILDENGEIDRGKLRQIVMSDEDKLKTLNGVVHPAVKSYIKDDIEDKRAEDYRYYVIEAALLIQDGYREICDEIWFIQADEEVRIDRLIKSRGYTREVAEEFIANQPDEQYYADNSDIVIENNGSQFLLEATLDLLLDKSGNSTPLNL